MKFEITQVIEVKDDGIPVVLVQRIKVIDSSSNLFDIAIDSLKSKYPQAKIVETKNYTGFKIGKKYEVVVFLRLRDIQIAFPDRDGTIPQSVCKLFPYLKEAIVETEDELNAILSFI